MPMTGARGLDNALLAERMEALAALLDLAGANYYSTRAYRRAAELIRATPAPVVELVREGRIRELRGIGPAIEARLRELVETGELAELRELETTVRPELVAYGRYLGLGAKRAVEIGEALGITTADELRGAIHEGRVGAVRGVGPTTERRLRAALEHEDRPRPQRALLLNRARALLAAIAEPLGAEIAGDPRRWRDTCEELAVVCAAARSDALLDAFQSLGPIVAVVDRDDHRAVGVTVEGLPVELVVAEPARFGTELMRATGSRAYVGALGPLPAAPREEDVYARLGLPFVEPELRERPFRGDPPALLELSDIRGDLHCHTTWSDGKASVYEMGLAAKERGYQYLAICDHTLSVNVVPGLGADDVRRQGEEIAAANERLTPFRILRGIECDILADGTLDLPDDVLVELDWVMASVHAGQRTPREALTARVVEALRNPHVSALSHPKGRIINHRPENALDLERVCEVAFEEGKALEVNGLPDRLDLRGEHVRHAVEAGVSVVVSTDAHSVAGLGNMMLAVATARRGWATAADIVNTRPLAQLAPDDAR
jgi:DNA polymerase (family X)